MQIIVVEDDNRLFKNMENVFTDAGITEIQRVSNGREAFLLIEKMEEKAIWIVDGVFPFRTDSRVEKLWPQVIERICTKRGENEVIMGFSSEPAIFSSMEEHKPEYIFDKSDFFQSTGEMITVILALSQNTVHEQSDSL